MTVVELHPQLEAPAPSDPPLLVTLDEAARLLSISLTTLKLLVGERQLSTVKLGRRRLVRRTDLVTFVESLEVATP